MIHKVLTRENYLPFHYQPVHNLLVGDFGQRLQFANHLVELSYNDADFLSQILWTDESQFTRDGIFFYHNCHVSFIECSTIFE